MTGFPERVGLQVETEVQGEFSSATWEDAPGPQNRVSSSAQAETSKACLREIHTKGQLGPSWTPAQQSSPEASPGRLAQPQGLAGDNRKVPTGQALAGLLPGTLWVSGLERSVSETVCPRRRQTGRGLQISLTGIKN